MKRVTVSPSAVKAMARKHTKASARLEGREVPDGHIRSESVERYIAGLAQQRRSDAASKVDTRSDLAEASPTPEDEFAEADVDGQADTA